MQKSKFYFLILVSCFLSCKDEISISENASAIELQYFEDYESPSKKWGYMDRSGLEVIDSKYDDARDYSWSKAAVNFKGKWGLIDEKGNVIIDYAFKQIQDVHEHKTFAQDFNNQWWLIHAHQDSNKVSVPYTNFIKFKNGHCVVARRGNWGVIDQDLNELVPCVFQSVKMQNDLIIIANSKEQALINLMGDTILPMKEHKLKFLNDYFIAIKMNKHYTVFDIEQNRVIIEDLMHVQALSDYVLLVKRNDKYFIFQTLANGLMPLDFEYVEGINDGYLKYKEKGKYGLLSPDGNVLSVAKYDLLNRFEEGFLVYGIGDYFGYLDQKGNEITGAEFPLAWDFHNGLARVIGRRGIGFINYDFELVIQDKYFEVRDFNNGLSRFQER